MQQKKLCEAIRTQDTARLMKTLQPQDMDLILEDGCSLLHFAIQLANEEVVKFLLLNNADPNLADARGSTALHLAAERRLINISEVLLGHRVTNPNAKDEDLYPPLHFAAQNGDEDTARLLLDKSASVNETDFEGRMPTHMACHHGQESVVRVLLSHGADACAPGKDDWTPLDYAAWKGHLAIVKLLVKQAGADLDSWTLDRRTALHLASQRGHYRVACILIELGANVSLTATDQYTALHTAAETGHTSTARLLVKHQASVQDQTSEGRTALHLAAKHGHLATVKMLVEQGADLHAVDVVLRTACHLAAEEGHCDVIKELLQGFPESSDITDVQGLTPLHLAMRGEYMNTVNILLSQVMEVPLVCQNVPSQRALRETEEYSIEPAEVTQLQQTAVIVKRGDNKTSSCPEPTRTLCPSTSC